MRLQPAIDNCDEKYLNNFQFLSIDCIFAANCTYGGIKLHLVLRFEADGCVTTEIEN